jgi:DNA-binding MarR family transcriptional regulator
MKAESYRELKVLEELAVNPSVTQRHLANRLEVALGLTNLMLRRLVKKGYIKVVNAPGNRIKYLLTPNGLTEKSRLTYEYLEYSLHLYREVRRLLTDALSRVVAAGGRRIVFFGTSEVAEIGYLTIRELGLELVGVIDGRAAGSRFLGFEVQPFAALTDLAFDCGIVSALNGGLDEIRGELAARGVPDGKVIIIEHHGPRVRLVGPAASAP